ncbi:hypothetical protein GCM10012275_37110 [Longimycelium tulufanense]|uniref:Uncharacterized protein n=1 Tax=Longimycelium tulufanense TaxID=907463 RepID=A0A8J3CG88_9PSEU|nr:hypothetical protein [Longimycelium tulufanense]GGM63027.1 hypothetical protein GCM10012275_37110 [Longimycelium tulufanense]
MRLGSTFDGSYEPVAEICAALDDLRRVLPRLRAQTAPQRGPEAASFSHGTT